MLMFPSAGPRELAMMLPRNILVLDGEPLSLVDLLHPSEGSAIDAFEDIYVRCGA